MFHNSTQKKHWTFPSQEEVQRLRTQANSRYRARIRGTGQAHLSEIFNVEPNEEGVICKYYEKKLVDFCNAFKPSMPKSVLADPNMPTLDEADIEAVLEEVVEDYFSPDCCYIEDGASPIMLVNVEKGTACMYFKRFYLNNSVMEHHPRIIMLTCAFLACKVDEFNVSSVQFVGNLPESPAAQERILEQILEYELLLIQQLNFHLIVHNPYRPFEGYLIDLKTRYPLLDNPEMLRKTADDFLNRVALTDACLLFTPSIIALTAVLSSACRAGLNMESYLLECLSLKDSRETMAHLLDGMKRLKILVSKYEFARPEDVSLIEKKLEKCYSGEVSSLVNLKKRKGYEDDDYISKKPRMEEEEWSDDDLVDSL